MTLVMPDGVPTLGAIGVKACPTIADPTQPKLATELNAAGSKDISLHLFPAGWAPAGDTPTGTAPARLGSKKIRQTLNRTTYTLAALQYIYSPQATSSDPANAAKTLLVEGTKIHLVERRGLDPETTAWAVGDKTRDHYVILGPQIEMGDPSDENGEFFIQQAVVYVSNDGPTAGTVVA